MVPKCSEQPPDPVESFLERYRRGTRVAYQAGLLAFIDFVMGTPNQRIKTGRDGRKYIRASKADMVTYSKAAGEYLQSARDKGHDYFLFIKYLDEKKQPPKTAHVWYIAVKAWLEHHDIVVSDKELKSARRFKPKGGKRTNFEYFDKATIREILAHGTPWFRAFVLVSASSGCRLGEVLALRWSDLSIPDRTKYPDKPASMFIRETKTGHSRTVYISREAELALSEWKKVIPSFRESADKKAERLKNPSKHLSDSMFPIGMSTIYEKWDEVLSNAGLMKKDEVTRRTRLNIHRLRNFFSVQVSAIDQPLAELLLGHTDMYGNAYSGRSEQEREEGYRKAEPRLTISEIVLPSKELAEVQAQLAAAQAQLARQAEQLAAMQQIDTVVPSNDADLERRVRQIMSELNKQ